ncbi:MAG: helix-turn-helix domain-containing protein [Chloroflexia bacterium]|nr:helix-turn-helix domain-containing protein [Chloroflexia bacterium]
MVDLQLDPEIDVIPEDVERSKRYTYLVRWSEEDQVFLASAAELPGSTTHGDSPDEALLHALDVAALWLAAYREWNQRIPKPRSHGRRVPRSRRSAASVSRIPMAPEEIRAVRDSLGMSQPVFASVLSVSVQAVRAWEQGHRRPNGAALRLMEILRENPAYGERLLVADAIV